MGLTFSKTISDVNKADIVQVYFQQTFVAAYILLENNKAIFFTTAKCFLFLEAN